MMNLNAFTTNNTRQAVVVFPIIIAIIIISQ